MKKWCSIAAAICLSVSAAFAADITFGTVDYVEGNATLTRSSKVVGDLNIGDPIAVNDMVKTGSDGVIVIALDKRTGMRGTLTVKPKSIAYIRLVEDKTAPRTTIDLMAGQIASKVAKLGGSPSMNVITATTAMGVRGTQYGVSTSINGTIMIYCTEGAVECRDDADTLSLTPGKAVEKKPSERLKFLPVAVSSPEKFERDWMTDEIEAFKSGGPRLVRDYEKRYLELYTQFNAAFDSLQKNAVLTKWMAEDRDGKPVNGMDPAVMREKKDMIGDINKLRKIMFMFERVYYRLQEIDGIVSGTALEKAELRPGVTSGDFLKRFRADADALARKVALVRYAEKLYEIRNQGGAGLPGMGGLSDTDFFGSSDF